MESILALMIYPNEFNGGDLKEIRKKKGFKNYTINNARYNMRKPLLTGVNKNNITEQAGELALMGTHFLNARREISIISNLYGFKIAS